MNHVARHGRHRMKNALFALAVATAALLSREARGAWILWVSVVDTARVVDPISGSGSTVSAFAQANGVNAARIRISGGDIPAGTDVFLDLPYEDETGWVSPSGITLAEYEPEDLSVSPGSGGGSSSGGDGSNGSIVWQPATIPVIYEGAATSAYTYTLELGAGDFDSGTFTVLATATATGDELLAAGNLSSGGLSQPSFLPWSPTTYNAVPEPATGLLAALGAVFLFVRRRRDANPVSSQP